jgi:hypothetical protein
MVTHRESKVETVASKAKMAERCRLPTGLARAGRLPEVCRIKREAPASGFHGLCDPQGFASRDECRKNDWDVETVGVIRLSGVTATRNN